MSKVIFGDVVRRCNTKEDRHNTDKIYYVGGEHIESNEVLVENRGLIEGSTIGPMFYFGFKAGDILFVSRNPHLRKSGMVTFDGICSEKTFVLETKDESVLLQRYLAFVMQSDHFWSYMEAHKSGSVNFFINWSTLAKYEFELPDVDKQKSISDVLWAINDTKHTYKNLIQKTDAYIRSQFVTMFSDKEKGSLSEIASITMGQSPDGKTYNNDGVGTPFYQGKTEFTDLYIGEPTTWTTAPTRIANANDVLMSVRAPVGSTNIATQECCLGRGLAGISPIDGKSTTLFILYAMRSIESEIESMGVGATFKAINKEQVYSIQVPIVSIAMQNQFVKMAQKADSAKNELFQSMANLDGLHSSLLAENFN